MTPEGSVLRAVTIENSYPCDCHVGCGCRADPRLGSAQGGEETPVQGRLGLPELPKPLPRCPACGLAAGTYTPRPGDGLPFHSLGTVEHDTKEDWEELRG